MPSDEANSVPVTPPAPGRPPMRRFYAMPPWFREETSKVPQAHDLRARLIEWFRQQRLDQEQREAAERSGKSE